MGQIAYKGDPLNSFLRLLTDGMPSGNLVTGSISSSIKSTMELVTDICEENKKVPNEFTDTYTDMFAENDELLEHLLGLSFVMCQVGIEHVVSTYYQFVQVSWVRHQKSKHGNPVPPKDFLSIPIKSNVTSNAIKKNVKEFNELKCALMKKENPTLGNGYSQIETINAFGNCFKHNDEWDPNWIDNDNNLNFTQRIIKKSLGNNSSVEFCKEGFDYLIEQQHSFAQVIELWKMVEKWADSIKERCNEDLRRCGCRK
jgi:hypothetical protein